MLGTNDDLKSANLEETESVTIWPARMHPGGEVLAAGGAKGARVKVERSECCLSIVFAGAARKSAPLGEFRDTLLGSAFVLAQFGGNGTPLAFRVRGARAGTGTISVRLEAL